MAQVKYPNSPLALTISNNKVWRTNTFDKATPLWDELATAQTAPFQQATAFKDFLTIGSDLYVLTDEGLWRKRKLKTASPFTRQVTISEGKLLRQVGKKGVGIYGGVQEWEHTFDFSQSDGGFVNAWYEGHNEPARGRYEPALGYWRSENYTFNHGNGTQNYQDIVWIEKQTTPFLIKGVEIRYTYIEGDRLDCDQNDNCWDNNGITWKEGNSILILNRTDESPNGEILTRSLILESPEIASFVSIRFVTGDAWSGYGGDVNLALTGSATIRSLKIYGRGFNPFTETGSSNGLGDQRVYYFTGSQTYDLGVGLNKGDTGYDCDDFSLGVHVAAADNKIYSTTTYSGTFQAISGLSVPVTNTKVRCLRVPYLQIEATKRLNAKLNDLYFIYGVSQPINNQTLFKVRFNTSTRTLAAPETPITPIIGGVRYKLVEGNGNQLETFGGDARKMVGFFERVDGAAGVFLLSSEDGGSSWEIRNSQFNGSQVYFVEPAQGGKGKEIWMSGASGVAFSADGGFTITAKKDSATYFKVAGPKAAARPAHYPNGSWRDGLVSAGAGASAAGAGTCMKANTVDQASVGNCSTPEPATCNPILLRDGTKVWMETDLEVMSPAASLLFTRTYQEDKQTDSHFNFMGLGWTHNHFYKLLPPTGTSPEREIEVRLPNGSNLKLVENPDTPNVFEALEGSNATLTYGNYTLKLTDGTEVVFNSAGEIQQRKWPQLEIWTYTHTNGKLTEVSDGYGRKVKFSYRNTPGQFDDGKLWRVGDQTATALDTGSPTGRYLELSYTPQKSNGTNISGAKALLSTVKDVRGQTWTYQYYGQAVGETDPNLLHRLLKRLSPSVDTTGDGVTDGSLTLEQLLYGSFANGKPTQLTQQRGNGLLSTLYEFPDVANDRLFTQETTAQRTITHHFANDGGEAGIYLYSENPLQQSHQDVLDINYQPTLRVDALGNETLLAWDETGEDLMRATNALGQATEFVYNANHTLQSSIDSEGRKTRYYYEDTTQPRLQTAVKVFNNLAETTLLQWDTWSYDNKGRVLSIKRLNPTNGSTLSEVTRAYYASGSGAGLLQSVTLKDQAPTPDDQTTTYLYDDYGRVVQVNQSSTFGSCAKSRTVYDAAGNVVASICNYENAGAAPTTAAEAIQLRQNTSNPDLNRVTVHEYDALGRRFKTTTEAGTTDALTTLTVYDALGRVIRTIANYNSATSGVTQPFTAAHSAFGHGADNMDNQVTDTVYNQRGQVRKQVDLLGNVTLFGYDEAGRLVKTVRSASQPNYNNDYNGDPSLMNYVPNAQADQDILATNAYNANGSLIKSVDVLGRVSLTGYDALNRVVKTIQNASQPTYDLTLDPDLSDYGVVVAPDQDMFSITDYDVMGQVVRTTDTLGNVTLYGYDALGRQVKVIRNASQPDYDLSNDPALNNYLPSTAADKDILSTSVYDVQGRIFQSTDVNGSVIRVVYDGLGRQVAAVASYVAPSGANADPATWGWDNGQTRWEDNANQPITHGTNNDENSLSQIAYDLEGRVKWTVDTLGRYTFYGYDDLNRRVRVIRNATNLSHNFVTDPDLSSYVPSGGTGGSDENRMTQTIYDAQGRVSTTIDERGNRTFYVYDKLGRQIKTVRNAKDAATLALNPGDGGYVAANDPRSSSYTLSSETDRDLVTRTVYDFAGRVTSTFDPVGRETRREYDLVGRVKKTITNYVNGVFSSAATDEDLISTTVYNKAGQVLSTADTYHTQTQFTYDAAGRRLTVTRAANTPLAVTDYTCYDKAGRVLRVIQHWTGLGEPNAKQPNGDWVFKPFNHGLNHDENRVTEYVRDALGRETKRIDPTGGETLIVYAKDGRVLSTTDPEGAITIQRYDKLRRVRRTVQGFQDNGVDPINWLWSSANNRWENGTGAALVPGTLYDRNQLVDHAYDRAGRRVSQRDARGKLTTYTYDKLDRRTALVNPLNQDWATSYADVNGGYKVTLNDPMNLDTERIFDRAGRLKNLNYLNETPKLTPNVTFTYDRVGNRTKMSEQAASLVRETFYTYDDMNRLTQVDFDTDGDVAIEQSVSYEYDARGLRTKLTMPGNLSVTYTYDERGQLLSLTDWDSQTTTYEYDGAGRPTQEKCSNGFKTCSRYDESGRLRWLQHLSPDELLQEFAFTVDKRGNRTLVREAKSQATPNNLIIPTDDSRINFYKGEWTTAGSYKISDTLTAALAIAFYGKTIMLTFGTGSDYGICDIYLDQTLWNSIDTYAASTGEMTVTISAYNLTGHVLAIHNRREKHPASTGYKLSFKQAEIVGNFYQHTLQHSYDTVSRLKQSAYRLGAAATGATFRQYDFTYDLAGNRTNQTVRLNGAVSSNVNYTYNNFNQLISDGVNNYTYDANGNLTSINGSPAYTWDRANRLLSYGGNSYTYNGSGQRVTQTVGGNVTQYLQDVQPALYKLLSATTGANTTRYVHDPMGIHSQENPDGSWNWMLNDGLGNVRGVIDANVNSVATMQYAPYGEVWDSTGTQPIFKFTGEQTDSNGLIYLRARHLNPNLGVFPSLDVLELANRYWYVVGNPTNLNDPTGMIHENPQNYSSCNSKLKIQSPCDQLGYVNRYQVDPAVVINSANAANIDPILFGALLETETYSFDTRFPASVTVEGNAIWNIINDQPHTPTTWGIPNMQAQIAYMALNQHVFDDEYIGEIASELSVRSYNEAAFGTILWNERGAWEMETLGYWLHEDHTLAIKLAAYHLSDLSKIIMRDLWEEGQIRVGFSNCDSAANCGISIEQLTMLTVIAYNQGWDNTLALFRANRVGTIAWHQGVLNTIEVSAQSGYLKLVTQNLPKVSGCFSLYEFTLPNLRWF